jgi:hypothetical protein
MYIILLSCFVATTHSEQEYFSTHYKVISHPIESAEHVTSCAREFRSKLSFCNLQTHSPTVKGKISKRSNSALLEALLV